MGLKSRPKVSHSYMDIHTHILVLNVDQHNIVTSFHLDPNLNPTNMNLKTKSKPPKTPDRQDVVTLQTYKDMYTHTQAALTAGPWLPVVYCVLCMLLFDRSF